MARVTKKRARELRHDRFRDTTMHAADRVAHGVAGRERTILYAVLGVVAAVALVGLYSWWSGRRSAEASAALGQAIEVAQAPVVTGTPLPNQTGPTFPSERERAQRAVEEFQRVAERYGDPHRELARFFRAANLVVVDRAKGVEELQALTRSGNADVAARSKFALAQAREADGQLDDAAKLYNELLGQKGASVAPDSVRLQLASVFERQGKRDEAAELLFNVVKTSREAKAKDPKAATPTSSAVREAERRLQKLSPERYDKLPPEPTSPAEDIH